MIYNENVRKIIETHTKKESCELLGLSPRQLDGLINYHCCTYVKKNNPFSSDKSKAIITDLEEGNLNQNEIAKKHGVSRQWVSFVKLHKEEN